MMRIAFGTAGVVLAALAAAVSLPAAGEEPVVEAVGDIQSMVVRPDGRFDVTCRSGDSEVASLAQIRADQVCRSLPPASVVVAVFQRPAGDFFVLCSDQLWQVATADHVRTGAVCGGGGTDPAPATVVSDGTQRKPYCSWEDSCTWDAAAQAECAQKLCEASGYTGGTFVSASNDPCTASFTPNEAWSWVLDKDNYRSTNFTNEAEITAACR